MRRLRSYEKELLDDDSIPFEDIRVNMKELDFINRWLGGHAITIEGFKQLLKGRTSVIVCEIGCGGGDNLLAIYEWCTQNNIEVSLTGIDIKEECIAFARSKKSLPASAKWIASDYRNVNFKAKPDIIFSSLFCHHFTDEQLVEQYRWMKDNCNTGFFVNDLERNTIAYYSIMMLTSLFSKSYLVKNDAPLSVTRGFKKEELQQICTQAGLRVNISWKWAFRYLLVYAK